MSSAEAIDLAAKVDELMKLSPAERLELADRLVVSVGGFASPEIEKAWLEEADRRYQELKSGKESGIPLAKAIEEARRELHARRQATSTGTSGSD